MPPEYVLQWVPLPWLVGVSVLATGVWLWKVAIRPAHRWAKAFKGKLDEFFEGWFGRPEHTGFPAEPGVPERLRNIEDLVPGWTTALGKIEDNAEAIKEISYHIQPNHNGSAHDALVSKLDALAEKIDKQSERQGRLSDAQLAVAAQLDRTEQDKRAAHEEILRRIGRIEQHRPAGEES